MYDKKTIVFYSYKGGTGRTLALANVASYLARFNFKVCIIDMDLEAPGIHYKFYKEAAQEVRNVPGVVDYIDYFIREKAPPPDIKPYLLRFNENISIMPSGDVTSDDYWYKLSQINWHALLYERDSSGLKLLLDLLGRIRQNTEKDKEFDYILIDSRAGITPLSGLCASLFGDMLVTFFSASTESLDGTKQMLKNVRETRKKDNRSNIPIIPVLTRFERYEDKVREDSFIAEKYRSLIDSENSLDEELCVIHTDREIERNERLIYGMDGTSEEDETQSEAPIQLDYLRFFSRLVDDAKMSDRVNMLLKKRTSTYSLINEPDIVQTEVEAISYVYQHKLVLEELVKIYKMRNINLLDQDKYLSAIARYYNVGGAESFVDEYYFEAFLHYFDNDKYYPKERFDFDFEKIFTVAENYTPEIKMQLAEVLRARYIDEHYQKAFELYKVLLQDDIFSIDAAESIMKLFAVKKDLYLDNSELLPDLHDPRLQDAKNSDFREAVYNVYVRYCLPEKANELLANLNVLYFLKQKMPQKLIEIYHAVGETDELISLVKGLVNNYVLSHDYSELNDLMRHIGRMGLMATVESILPKDEPMIRDMLRRYQ